MSVGMMASFISTVTAPAAPRSSTVTGFPARSVATTMAPSRSRMSAEGERGWACERERERVGERGREGEMANPRGTCTAREQP